MDFTPAVLRNAGVPVRVGVVLEDGTLQHDADGVPVRIVKHVRFDANAIATLEERFARYETTNAEQQPIVLHGSDALQRASFERPTSTIRTVFAVAWGMDETEAGRLIFTDEQAAYLAAINAGLAIAQGMDPTLATEMIRLGLEVADTARAAMSDALGAMVAAADSESTGNPGSPPGSDSTDPLTSSGG